MPHVKLIFISGFAGTGKTTLAHYLVKVLNAEKLPTCVIDKDTVASSFVNDGMQRLGLNPNDRDSVEYKKYFRDVEYNSVLDIAKENLKLGLNVICPAPWTEEIKNEKIFSLEELGLTHDKILKKVEIKHIHFLLSPDDMIKNIISRGSDRDQWKLKNWQEYSHKFSNQEDILKILNKHNSFVISKKLDYQKSLSSIFCYISNIY